MKRNPITQAELDECKGHTPEPWYSELSDDGHEIRMATANESTCKYQVQHIVEYNHGLFEQYDDGEDVSEVELKQFREAEANAKLIALAPRLLAEVVRLRYEKGAKNDKR